MLAMRPIESVQAQQQRVLLLALAQAQQNGIEGSCVATLLTSVRVFQLEGC
jgi:site-specific recombinase XerC